jgi:hypothetical protein
MLGTVTSHQSPCFVVVVVVVVVVAAAAAAAGGGGGYVHESRCGGSVSAYDDHLLLRWSFHRWLDNARAAQRMAAAEEAAHSATITSVRFFISRLYRKTFLALREFVVALHATGVRVATTHALAMRRVAFGIWKGTTLYLYAWIELPLS